MADSVSLAVLENLVHMSRQDFPAGYVVVGATIPTHIKVLEEDQLRYANPSLSPQWLGDNWLENGQTAVLRVRSAVVPNDWNYLLNPQHIDFAAIVAELPMPFRFDERLFRSAD